MVIFKAFTIATAHRLPEVPTGHKCAQMHGHTFRVEVLYKPPVRRQIVWTYLARKNRSWSSLEPREVKRTVDLLETNLDEEPYKDKNLRLWVQAVRRAEHPPTIESVIEKITYWKINSKSLDATYYLYVFYVLLGLEGSTLAREEACKYIDECRNMARSRRNRMKSIEWLGQGDGIKRLVYHSELGEWSRDDNFWTNKNRLTAVRGRISQADKPQAGKIEIIGDLSAFYVPALAGGVGGHRINKLVTFFLGFSYDGLRAWEVKDAE